MKRVMVYFSLIATLIVVICASGIWMFIKEKDVRRLSEKDLKINATEGDSELSHRLDLIRKKRKVPAIIAVRLNSKGIQQIACTGIRKAGHDIPVTLNDRWHLGSCTKAMTATLVARLVEKNILNWDWSLKEIFPDLAEKMDTGFGSITLRELLGHRSGLPDNLPNDFKPAGSLMDQRHKVVERFSVLSLISVPGTQYRYSNLGYAVVGAIVEKVTGRSYEEMMKEEVFVPLGMNSYGWGGLGTIGMID